MTARRARTRLVLVIFLVACLAAIAVAACVGPSGWRSPWPWTAISSLRVPRVALSAVVGASLAIAGVAMQSLLQNDLADPYILGLSGGASCGAVVSLALWPGLVPGPAAAAGAACAALLVRSLARGPYDPTRLLLAGVAVSSILGGVTGLVLVLVPASQLLRSTTYWLFGGFGSPRPAALIVPAIVFAGAFVWLLAQAERLDRLLLGQDTAATLGVEVPRLRRGILLVSVALTSVVVAAGGLIGFVGLMAPHAARRLVGPTHRYLLPIAALGGALLCVVADTIARTAFAPRDVPVGLLTAALGGPFFLWQLQRSTR